MPHALAVYKHFKGIPPEGYDVHHINGDATLLENDNLSNLIAVPKIWNRNYFPHLAREFKLPESRITEVYVKLVDAVSTDDLFKEVCRHLLTST